MKRISIIISVMSILAMFSCQKYELEETKEKAPQVEITLKSGNSITENPDTVKTDVALIFYAKVNYGNISEFIWDFGDLTGESQGQQVIHKYEQEGNYTITLVTYDGIVYNTIYLDLVVSNQGSYYPVFSLRSSGNVPNTQGKLQYTMQFLRSAIPTPPVPAIGPYFYIGSNEESNWEEVTIVNDTSDLFAWYSIYSYDTVYDQAFGGWENNNAIWGNMETSEFFNESLNYLRVGFQDGSIYTENAFQNFIPGSTGDDLPYPPVRIDVSNTDVTIYVDIRRQAEGVINTPKARYKTEAGASWSALEDMTWIGGTGYAKIVLNRGEDNVYFLRVWSRGSDSDTEIDFSSSTLWDENQQCIKFEIIELD